MNTRSIIIATLLLFGTFLSYSQVVASLDAPHNLPPYHGEAVGQISYDVIHSKENASFDGIEYSVSSQKLALNTKELVQFISIMKDGEVYLKNMPVLSTNIKLSMKNYSAGDYELHLTVEGKKLPTIIELVKS